MSDAWRLLTIQSHVVTGYVGNRSATFPAQLLGWDVDAVNTVQFSNHTGYGRWGGQRFDERHLTEVFEGLATNNLLTQNRVLTGYTPSPEALTAIERLILQMRETNPALVYLLDPVMGDMDRGMYVNPHVLPIYRRMLYLSTIICPNQFEAQVLAGQEITSLATLRAVQEKLHVEYRVPHVVITSLSLPPEDLKCLGAKETMPDGQEAMLLVGSTWDNGLQSWFMQFPCLGEYFSGVGDLFAALVLARFSTQPDDLPEPARAAHSFEPATSESECTLPIARAVMLAVAALQQVLLRTRAAMTEQGKRLHLDPFLPSHKLSVDERVKTMRLRELRLVQSAHDILHPRVQFRPQWARP
ncbi:pyridoxal kinase [Malassezia nana]|uniref:pyridoxal kinase n=1 Tax=Malassezia nana TaxID=180528 RepID=A0AAF0EP66_9BASI|nr:pyridoxal kinase [Malassezia nana]